MNTNTAIEYRNLPLAVLTESATNPRRIFEDSALKGLPLCAWAHNRRHRRAHGGGGQVAVILPTREAASTHRSVTDEMTLPLR